MAKSEQFTTTGLGNWDTESTILLVAKNSRNGILIEISGYTENFTLNGTATVRMENKGVLGNVGKEMFKQVNNVAQKYPNKTSITYNK